MRALVSFRKDRMSPIDSTFNVAGAGYDHIENIVSQYSASRKDLVLYGYWSITFNQQNPDLRSLVLRKGIAGIRPAKTHKYKAHPDYNGFQLPAGAV